MAKPLTLNDLPEDLAHFARAEMAAGHFPSIEDVLRAGVDALRERAQGEWLASLRRDAAEGFASFDRGEVSMRQRTSSSSASMPNSR
jgi:Arc/MetJ-type ribon-helix-helix transcriptional regulator